MTDNLNDSIYKKAQNNDDSIISAGAVDEPDYAEPIPTPVKIVDAPTAVHQSMEVDYQPSSPRVYTDLATTLNQAEETFEQNLMELDLFYDLRNDKQGNDKIGLAAKDMVTKKLKKVKLRKIG